MAERPTFTPENEAQKPILTLVSKEEPKGKKPVENGLSVDLGNKDETTKLKLEGDGMPKDGIIVSLKKGSDGKLKISAGEQEEPKLNVKAKAPALQEEKNAA